MDPRDAGAELARADALRDHLAGALRLPGWFHESIGAAVAVQIGVTAFALSRSSSPTAATVALLLGGVAVFVVVAAVQLQRFRRLNGVWVGGLASQAVLGTSTLSSVVYAASLAGAGWAALAGLWWLATIATVAGGIGYAVSGRRWWAAYLRHPEQHARGESTAYVVGVVVLCLLGLAVLLVSSR
jgi:hypothetical protein